MSEPTVILNNYHGLAIRTFGHTRFPAAVRERGRLLVLSDSEGPQAEWEDFGAERLPLWMPPATPVKQMLLYLRKDAFFQAHRTETHLLKEARLKRRWTQRLPAACLRRLPGLAGFRLMDAVFGAYLRSRPEARRLTRILEQHRPCVVLDNLHNNMSGALLKVASENAGVPICGFIQSWDKLTTKNPIHGTYDRYLVWGETMKKELVSLYPWVRPDTVIPTGTPQFDYYYDPDYQLSREELCRRLRLNPARPILTYTTVSVGYSRGEERVLDLLIRSLQDRYGSRMPNVVIRPRPNPLTPDQERFRPLEALAPGSIHVMQSDWKKRRSADGVSQWGVPNREDMVRYTSLMRHTDIGLAISSTTVLEWLLCDRPVVNFCFDPDDPNRPDPVSCWMVGFTHYRFVREGPGVAFTEGLQPAVDAIDRYLQDPSLHASGRQAMRRQVLGWQDGHNAERVALEVLRLAGAECPPPAARPADPAQALPPLQYEHDGVLV